jgi:hypothetical protein
MKVLTSKKKNYNYLPHNSPSKPAGCALPVPFFLAECPSSLFFFSGAGKKMFWAR